MNHVFGKVTVLIPVYNRANYIRETIESALMQNYENIEIICVDDGSTDSSGKILEEYASQNKIIMLNHPGGLNKGQSASINLALQQATGEYIAILDSDDLFAPGKIAAQVAYLDAHRNIGLVYGNGKAIDANGSFLYEISYDMREEKSDANEILLDCYFLLPQNSLVRAEIYDTAGFFDEALRAAQDHDMLIRIAEKTKIAHMRIDSFRYRRHADSISAKGTEKRWRSGVIILRNAAKRYPYKKNILRKRLATVNFRLAEALYQNKKNYIEATSRLLLSGILDPIRAFKVLFGIERKSRC